MAQLTPDYFYYFYPIPKRRVLKFLVLINPKTGNARGFRVRKIKRKKE